MAGVALAVCMAIGSAHGRIDPSQRAFNSSSINALIDNYTARMKDPDLAMLFNNCYPNTLDTTIEYFVK